MMVLPLLMVAFFLSGSISADISVTENDNTPKFSRSVYFVKVKEISYFREPIIQVSATGTDHSPIHYSLDNAEGSSFRINSTTGVIYTIDVLDRETTSDYSFRVLAVDSGDPPKTGTATVTINIIDVNDNTPKFGESFYTFEVVENSDPYMAIGTVTAFDRDQGKNAFLQYFMYPHDINIPFEVLHNGTVITTFRLDREMRNHYNFMICVRDSDIFSQALIAFTNVTVDIIDVNDNAPIILFPNKWSNSISSAVTYLPITNIQAYDADNGINGQLNFFIQSGNDKEMVNLNSQTGELFLNRDFRFNTNQSASMTICVRDSGLPAQTSCVQLNVEVIVKEETD